MRPRTVTLTVSALAALAVLAAWALTLGSYELSVGEVAAALLGTVEGGTGGDTGKAAFIVHTLRLPRLLTTCLVGAALAMSGAVFQGLVRNPLAAPDIIGINGGASVAVVFWITAGYASGAVPVVAFGGAVTAALLVYLLSWRGRIDPTRLILVGIGINAMATAGVTALVIRADINEAGRAYQWMAGSLYATNWPDVQVMTLSLAVLAPVTAVLMRPLRILQLGDIGARGVGLRVELMRLCLLLVGCALAALAVSVTGPIGFIALMTPHVARMVAGNMTSGVLAFTAVLGGVLLLVSDMVAQHALPVVLPVGVLTAAVGAPYFLYLLHRSRVSI